MNDLHELMTLQQVADYLKLSMAQIYNMTRDNELPIIRVSDMTIRVRRGDLDSWLESKKNK